MSNEWQLAAGAMLGSPIASHQQLGGGDFASAYQVTLEDARVVFVKTHTDPPANFFSTEAAGLEWLREAVPSLVPAVLGVSDDPPWLALAWVDIGPGRTDDFGDADFGRALASLHASGAPCFGRKDRRTTGSLALPNDPLGDWASFYAERRLLPLAQIASVRGSLPAQTIDALLRVAGRLCEFGGADEAPGRLHGDLWAGNRVVDVSGRSWLVDPAAHGGHREFDLAMMRLFGGFSETVFAAYVESTPLAPGWRERVPLHQLAPLVVHAIKFGGHYRAAVADALAPCA